MHQPERRKNVHLRRGDEIPRQKACRCVIIAGKEYGSGSSRDWAAKGTMLLGVRAVLAESFERIHRSNLVGMGVLPLEFLPGENAEIARPDGPRNFRHRGPGPEIRAAQENASVARATRTAKKRHFTAIARVDTPSKSPTTSTAAFCSTSCAKCSEHMPVR